MKKTLLFLTLAVIAFVLCGSAYSQTLVPTGAVNTIAQQAGGYQVNGYFSVPSAGVSTPYALARQEGRMHQFGDGSIRGYMGGSWRRFLTPTDSIYLTGLIATKYAQPSFGPGKYIDGNGLAVAFPTVVNSEVDPIFVVHPSHGISSGNISNWQSAYSWGPHSGMYKPISYTPSQSEIYSAIGVPLYTEVDGSITNEIELPAQSGNTGKFLQTNSSIASWQPALVTEVDGSTTNEIQSLSVSGNTLSISSGNSINLPSYSSGSGISISSGVISATDASATNEIQSLNFNTSTNDLSISGGNTVNIPLGYSSQIYTPTRPINSTSFIPSSTKPFRVYYTITIACTATIGSAASASVVLQYFDGSTWQDFNNVANSNTVTLAVVLNSVNSQTSVLSGEFSANTQLRMVSTTSGPNAVISIVRSKEVY